MWIIHGKPPFWTGLYKRPPPKPGMIQSWYISINYLASWTTSQLHYDNVIMGAMVSNHQPHDCLLNRLFRRGLEKTSKLRVTGLCEGNSPVTGEFPAQRASNTENVSIWWRRRVFINTFSYSFTGARLNAKVGNIWPYSGREGRRSKFGTYMYANRTEQNSEEHKKNKHQNWGCYSFHKEKEYQSLDVTDIFYHMRNSWVLQPQRRGDSCHLIDINVKQMSSWRFWLQIPHKISVVTKTVGIVNAISLTSFSDVFSRKKIFHLKLLLGFGKVLTVSVNG